MTKTQKYFLATILILAAFFRFYMVFHLECEGQCGLKDVKLQNIQPAMPGGLFPDEAANGLDINLMQQGQLQPFYERGNGREALFFYMLWGSVAAFGKGAWQHHIVSALVGWLSVLMCFLFTRKLFSLGAVSEDVKRRATNLALLASFLMAVSSWHTVLSRTAFRANLIPLFTTATLYFLLAAYDSAKNKAKIWYSLLAGSAFALGFYTYIAYRILAPILFMVLVWPWFANGVVAGVKKYWKYALLFTAAFIVFFYPIGKYFYTHPGSFVGRSGQVSVFNPDLNQGNLPGAVGEVFKESMLAYFTSGDLNWRHNVSGLPFLSPLVSPFFGLALVAALWLGIVYFFSPRKHSGYWQYFLLTGWFWGMLLPVITTAEGIPHGLRSIGTIPAVFILAAIGLMWFAEGVAVFREKIWQKILGGGVVWDWNKQESWKLKGYQLGGFLLKSVVGLFFVSLVLQTYFIYFVYAANSPENFYAFRSDLTPVSKYLVERCKKDSTYLVLDKFSVQTTDYTTSDWHGNFSSPCSVPYIQVDPEDSWKLGRLKIGDQVVFTQSSIFDIKKFKAHHPEALLVKEIRNKFGQAVMAVYEISK